MTFEDLYPHKNGVATGYDLFTRQVDAKGFEGLRLNYRLGFQSTAIDELPTLAVGRVTFTPHHGPIQTQRTDIVQEPDTDLIFHKTMYLGLNRGKNLPLLIAQVWTTATSEPNSDIRTLREEVLAAAGLLAATLDERVVLEEVFEDALMFAADGSGKSFDRRPRLRKFYPRYVSEQTRGALESLSEFELGDNPATNVAARWYLKAAQEGPTTSSIVYFWVALEALVAEGTEWRNAPKRVETALEDVGVDLGDLPLSVGRLYGLRADIVHHGEDQPAELVTGWYVIEAIVRILIRHRIGISSDWPAQVSTNYLTGDTGARVDRIWAGPGKTYMTTVDATGQS